MLLEKELGLTENSYYEASIERPPPSPMLAGRIAADVCVVGGRYSGLSAALELVERGYSVEGLHLLRDRIARYAIDCDYQPGYLTLAVNARKANKLAAWVIRRNSAFRTTLAG